MHNNCLPTLICWAISTVSKHYITSIDKDPKSFEQNECSNLLVGFYLCVWVYLAGWNRYKLQTRSKNVSVDMSQGSKQFVELYKSPKSLMDSMQVTPLNSRWCLWAIYKSSIFDFVVPKHDKRTNGKFIRKTKWVTAKQNNGCKASYITYKYSSTRSGRRARVTQSSFCKCSSTGSTVWGAFSFPHSCQRYDDAFQRAFVILLRLVLIHSALHFSEKETCLPMLLKNICGLIAAAGLRQEPLMFRSWMTMVIYAIIFEGDCPSWTKPFKGFKVDWLCDLFQRYAFWVTSPPVIPDGFYSIFSFVIFIFQF